MIDLSTSIEENNRIRELQGVRCGYGSIKNATQIRINISIKDVPGTSGDTSLLCNIRKECGSYRHGSWPNSRESRYVTPGRWSNLDILKLSIPDCLQLTLMILLQMELSVGLTPA